MRGCSAAFAVVGLLSVASAGAERRGRVTVSAMVIATTRMTAAVHGGGPGATVIEVQGPAAASIELLRGGQVEMTRSQGAPILLRAGAAPVQVGALHGTLLWKGDPPDLVVTFLTDGAAPAAR